jgi:hypothetical protein
LFDQVNWSFVHIDSSGLLFVRLFALAHLGEVILVGRVSKIALWIGGIAAHALIWLGPSRFGEKVRPNLSGWHPDDA